MTTIREYYKRVETAWPEHPPALRGLEAVRSARRLYRYAMGETFTGRVEVTSGNRHTWIRRGTLYVNPDRGWKYHVHLLSHAFWRRANRGEDIRPHEKGHARLELNMVKEVLRRGWLEGKLYVHLEPTKSAPAETKLDRVQVAIARWESKKRRAENALKKLRRRAQYYERINKETA